MSLNIVQIPASDMDNYSYVVYCPSTSRAVGIDPSMKPEAMLEVVEQHELSLELVINTHGHNDHIAGNNVVLEKTGARLAAHPADQPDTDIKIDEGTVLSVGIGHLQVMHTPGHTPGSVVLYSGKDLITGDTLFVSRCGRADLPGSDPEALYNSLQRIKALPPETQIFPGHNYGPKTVSTLAWELENNDFLKCPDLESFITLRMG